MTVSTRSLLRKGKRRSRSASACTRETLWSGTSDRRRATAIGDAINVAARIEGLSKEAGYRLICSQAAAERLPLRSSRVALGSMAIKGHTPVEVYGYDKVALPQREGDG